MQGLSVSSSGSRSLTMHFRTIMVPFCSGKTCSGPMDQDDDGAESSADSDLADELFQDYLTGVP